MNILSIDEVCVMSNAQVVLADLGMCLCRGDECRTLGGNEMFGGGLSSLSAFSSSSYFLSETYQVRTRQSVLAGTIQAAEVQTHSLEGKRGQGSATSAVLV